MSTDKERRAAWLLVPLLLGLLIGRLLGVFVIEPANRKPHGSSVVNAAAAVAR